MVSVSTHETTSNTNDEQLQLTIPGWQPQNAPTHVNLVFASVIYFFVNPLGEVPGRGLTPSHKKIYE